MKLFKPAVFQGNLSSSKYFEGWYFKHVSRKLDKVYAFIPGISLNKTNPHSFIQVINGITGESSYTEYPLKSFDFDKDNFLVRVGDSVFTQSYAELNIRNESGVINGHLEYSDSVPYPSSLFSPGIMGWYSFVPAMECKHAIVSVTHNIAGSLDIYGEASDFMGGKGYIEKDWGTSFPEAWIWVQSNNFPTNDASLMVSIAKIPWLGSYFTGFIGFFYSGGEFYRFSTYNNSRIISASYENKKLNIVISNNHFTLYLIVSHSGSGHLKAPVSGSMNRIIKESIDSEVNVKLVNKSGEIIFDEKGSRTGLEIVEKIFEYIK